MCFVGRNLILGPDSKSTLNGSLEESGFSDTSERGLPQVSEIIVGAEDNIGSMRVTEIKRKISPVLLISATMMSWVGVWADLDLFTT